MNEPLQTTLIDAAAFLEARHIPYALIGGLAVSMRARPRVTADVDLVIDADIDRALALADGLSGTQFRALFDGVADVIRRTFILPLMHRHTKVKVDLPLGLSGFEQQAILRAERLQVAGSPVSVATAEDLIIMKVLAGRPQDEQDVRGLVLAQGDRLDWQYCLTTAAELGDAIGQPLEDRIRALRDSES